MAGNNVRSNDLISADQIMYALATPLHHQALLINTVLIRYLHIDISNTLCFLFISTNWVSQLSLPITVKIQFHLKFQIGIMVHDSWNDVNLMIIHGLHLS